MESNNNDNEATTNNNNNNNNFNSEKCEESTIEKLFEKIENNFTNYCLSSFIFLMVFACWYWTTH